MLYAFKAMLLVMALVLLANWGLPFIGTVRGICFWHTNIDSRVGSFGSKVKLIHPACEQLTMKNSFAVPVFSR